MRTTHTLLLGVVVIAALAFATAPEANAGPFGQSARPVLADVYIGFGYGGNCSPYPRRTYVRRTYYRPRYYTRYAYRPVYHPRRYYTPYYYPRFSVGFGYHAYPRYSYPHYSYPHYSYPHYSGHHYRGHHSGHYRGRHSGHHHGSRRAVGRRR